MKKQDRLALKDLPLTDLKAQLSQIEEKIFKLRFTNSVARVKNPLEIRHMRRQKARLLTWLRAGEAKAKAASK